MKTVIFPYDELKHEELVNLLKEKDVEIEKLRAKSSSMSAKTKTLHDIFSEVLLIFYGEKDLLLKKALYLLQEYFQADRGCIDMFDEEVSEVNFSCVITSDKLNSLHPDVGDHLLEKNFWFRKQIRSERDIVILEPNDLPEEAHTEKKMMEALHLQSTVILPLVFYDKIIGFVEFDKLQGRPRLTPAEINELYLVADIFSIIIQYEYTRNKLNRSEKQISELSSRFKLFFDNLPIGVELYDAEGYMIDMNNADMQIFGATRESLLGINLFKHPLGTKELLDLMRSGKPFNYPFVYQFENIQQQHFYQSKYTNSVKYLTITGMGLGMDENAKPIGYLVMVTDETEKQMKEEQMKNNLAILKAVLLSGRSLVVEYDIEKKQLFVDSVLNDNPSDNQLFQYLCSGKKFSFDDLKEIVHTEQNVRQLIQVIEGKQDHCSFIFRTRMKDETVWIRFNAQAYQTRWSDRADKLICYLTNITEEKTLEEKLHYAEYETRQSELEMQKIREADKLKSAFLANMSHEIRTPLNAIVGFSTILADNNRETENNEFVKIIHENNDLLLRLISDILDFSKIESGVLDYYLEDTDLKELCFGQYQIHALKMSRNVSLIYDRDAMPAVRLHTDSRRIAQVISNLISNATKFTEKGTITLSYQLVEGGVQITVTDTGIGIPAHLISNIFERFYKVDSFKQGTGLGLPICKTIVESLHGTIGVSSEIGKGSHFWFTLPFTPVD